MENRIYYFDRLRICSTFAVVLIHIAGAELFNYPVGSFNWNLYNILDSLSRFCVPVFVMLSGALFLNPKRAMDVKQLYIKNIMRLVVAFVFWSVVYALVDFSGDIRSFIRSVLAGHYHMWFLYMLAGLYVCIPFLRKITESEFLTRYFLFFSVLFTFILPLLSNLPNLSVIGEITQKMRLNTVVGYASYFVAGYYFSNKELGQGKRAVIYILGMIGFVATILLTYISSASINSLNDDFYSFFSVTVLAQSVAVFVFAKHNLEHSPKNERVSDFLSRFSKLTFGIYLVHVLVLEQINLIGVFSYVNNELVCVFAKSLTVFFISALISYLINKVPVVNKYIV